MVNHTINRPALPDGYAWRSYVICDASTDRVLTLDRFRRAGDAIRHAEWMERDGAGALRVMVCGDSPNC